MTAKQERFALVILTTLMGHGVSESDSALITSDICEKMKGERHTVPDPLGYPRFNKK